MKRKSAQREVKGNGFYKLVLGETQTRTRGCGKRGRKGGISALVFQTMKKTKKTARTIEKNKKKSRGGTALMRGVTDAQRKRCLLR